MATGARLGKNTEFRRGDGGSPEIFTLVPEITGTIQVGEESPEVDVTNFDSTAVERIPDLPDGTPIELSMNFKDHAQQNALIADVKAQINRNYQIYNPAFTKLYNFVLAPLMWGNEFAPK